MSKPKFHIGIKNAVAGETLELYFLEDLYNKVEFDWYSGMTETNVVEDVINQVKNYNPQKVKLIIDSQGGDCGIGIAVYNFLKNYNAKVETDVIGMAGSIASVLMQAANKGKRLLARNAFVVIHKAWGGGIGNADDLRAYADVVDKYTEQIVDIYVQNNTKGKTAEDINALIAGGDYWMTGQEAVDLGFADEIYNDNANFQVAARIKNLNGNYHNVPQNLISEADALEADSPKNFFFSLKNDCMKILNEIKTAFAGLKTATPAAAENTTETVNAAAIIEGIETALTPSFEAIENTITGIEERTLTAEELAEFRGYKAQLEAANATIATLQTDISNLQGGEANPKNETPGVKPIGAFVK